MHCSIIHSCKSFLHLITFTALKLGSKLACNHSNREFGEYLVLLGPPDPDIAAAVIVNGIIILVEPPFSKASFYMQITAEKCTLELSCVPIMY